MNLNFTPQLNEVGDGFLLMMFFFAAIYFVFYLWRAWRENVKFYTYENKTALALLTVSSGMVIKVGIEWWWLHIRNNGDRAEYPLLVPLFITGTLVASWGLICLLRSLSRYEWPKFIWLALVAVAFAFAIYFAL